MKVWYHSVERGNKKIGGRGHWNDNASLGGNFPA